MIHVVYALLAVYFVTYFVTRVYLRSYLCGVHVKEYHGYDLGQIALFSRPTVFYYLGLSTTQLNSVQL